MKFDTNTHSTSSRISAESYRNIAARLRTPTDIREKFDSSDSHRAPFFRRQIGTARSISFKFGGSVGMVDGELLAEFQQQACSR
jgi:hypothetical protein